MNQKTALIAALALVAIAVLSVVAWNGYKQQQDERPCRDAASAAVLAGRSGSDALKECLDLARIVREHGLD